MNTQSNTELDGGRDFAGTRPIQGKSNFHPKKGKVRYLMEENAALKAQLEDSHFQQHLFHCRWVTVDRKSRYLMAQLEEAHRTYKQSTAGAEATIKELKDQLEQARSNETRSYDEEIQRLKVELAEARIERVNAVNGLLHADKIMASLNLKLD